HACGTRHMTQAGPTCVLGVRSGSREEFADADKMLTAWSDDLVVPDVMRAEMRGVPVFVSVDMDVLDPSILPGTGNPEPGGPTYRPDVRDRAAGPVVVDHLARRPELCRIPRSLSRRSRDSHHVGTSHPRRLVRSLDRDVHRGARARALARRARIQASGEADHA